MRGTMNSWSLYWSPEGRKIATVEAKTRRAAIRKAPQPYRKYFGEIYAVADNPNAWFAVITLHSEGFLLGGTRRHESVPFASEQMARDFADVCVETNKGAGRTDVRLEIVGTYSDNPVR